MPKPYAWPPEPHRSSVERVSRVPPLLEAAFSAAGERLRQVAEATTDHTRLFAPLGETLTWLLAADEAVNGEWWKGRRPPFTDGERVRLGLRWARNVTMHGRDVMHFPGREVVIGGVPGRMMPGTLSAVPGGVFGSWVFAASPVQAKRNDYEAYVSDVAGRALLLVLDGAWAAVAPS